jgi:hypothetical protein
LGLPNKKLKVMTKLRKDSARDDRVATQEGNVFSARKKLRRQQFSAIISMVALKNQVNIKAQAI